MSDSTDTAPQHVVPASPRRTLHVFAAGVIVLATVLHLVVVRLDVPATILDVPWWTLALFYLAAEFRVVLFHFRSETQGFSLTEVPLVVGLFASTPLELVGAAVLGTMVALLTKRPQRNIKLLVNVAQVWLSTSVGILVFHALGGDSTTAADPVTWLPAGAAALVANYVSVGIVQTAIALSEGRLDGARVAGAQIAAVLAAGTSTALGLIVVVFLSFQPSAVLLLIGPLVAIDLTLRAYAAQRERTERLDFLYRSIQTLQEHPVVDEALSELLALARETFRARHAEMLLVTGDDRVRSRRLRVSLGEDRGQLLPTDVDDDDRALLEVLRDRGTVLFDTSHSSLELVRLLAARDLDEVVAAALPGETHQLGYVLVADHVSDVKKFTQQEARLFAALAAQLSVWLENNRLERTLEEITTLQAQLSYQAYHDTLTGLPNRAAFNTHVVRALEETPGRRHALLYVDIDDFKVVNDTRGHDVGDELLVAIARRLDGQLRDDDLAARLGGDEFAVVLRDVDLDRARGTAERLARRIEEPIDVRGERFRVRASVGIALTPADSGSDWLRHADQAMYVAKHLESSQVAVYEDVEQILVAEADSA